jgi:hypothetical protein
VHRTDKTIWILAGVVPILASVAAWLWTSATLTPACASGQPAAGPGVAGIVLLVLAGPIATGAQAWRAKSPWPATATTIAASTLLSIPLIYLTLSLCWVAHGCYT